VVIVVALDRERIADAALAVLDARGASGFTMRAVAEALGVTPMAPYHYVKDKAELAALVIQTAVDRHPLPPVADDWQDDLWAVADWFQGYVQAHPAIVQLRRDQGVWTETSFIVGDRWLGAWRRSGLEEEAASTAATISALVVVSVIEEDIAGREVGEGASGPVNLRRGLWVPRDHGSDFEVLVRSLVDGPLLRLGGRTTRGRRGRPQAVEASRS
jgi:AcrR family transcriptional regulator